MMPNAARTAQGMDSLGALADQTIAGAKHYRCGLRLLAFHGHEPHGGALSGLTDGLGIRSLSLLSLDERLPVRRRDQLHRVAEFTDLPAPVVGAGAGLHRNCAGRQSGEERQNLVTPQLLAEDHRAGCIRSVRLKHVLGEI